MPFMKARDFIAPLLIALILFVFYGNLEPSLSMANKIAALTGIALFSLSFIAGPIAYFWPKLFEGMKQYRKPWGQMGLALILIHAAISLNGYYSRGLEKFLAMDSVKLMGVILATMSLLVFVLITWTSSDYWIKKLGFEKWKKLQMLGYVALLLGVMHFFLMEIKTGNLFSVRPLGQVIFYFSILVLAVKLVSMLYSEYYKPLKQKPKVKG